MSGSVLRVGVINVVYVVVILRGRMKRVEAVGLIQFCRDLAAEREGSSEGGGG